MAQFVDPYKEFDSSFHMDFTDLLYTSVLFFYSTSWCKFKSDQDRILMEPMLIFDLIGQYSIFTCTKNINSSKSSLIHFKFGMSIYSGDNGH